MKKNASVFFSHHMCDLIKRDLRSKTSEYQNTTTLVVVVIERANDDQ